MVSFKMIKHKSANLLNYEAVVFVGFKYMVY